MCYNRGMEEIECEIHDNGNASVVRRDGPDGIPDVAVSIAPQNIEVLYFDFEFFKTLFGAEPDSR